MQIPNCRPIAMRLSDLIFLELNKQIYLHLPQQILEILNGTLFRQFTTFRST